MPEDLTDSEDEHAGAFCTMRDADMRTLGKQTGWHCWRYQTDRRPDRDRVIRLGQHNIQDNVWLPEITSFNDVATGWGPTDVYMLVWSN